MPSGYEIFVNCSLETCESRVEVEQLDALPLEWVVLRCAETRLTQGRPEVVPVTDIFCSWKCVNTFSHQKETAVKPQEELSIPQVRRPSKRKV